MAIKVVEIRQHVNISANKKKRKLNCKENRRKKTHHSILNRPGIDQLPKNPHQLHELLTMREVNVIPLATY
jgi:hypothetical protein